MVSVITMSVIDLEKLNNSCTFVSENGEILFLNFYRQNWIL